MMIFFLIQRFLILNSYYKSRLSDKRLSAVDHHKHLGVWLESSLSWDCHVNYICAKANKILGLIRRTFGPNNSEGVSTAYKTLVRPILEYGCHCLLYTSPSPRDLSTSRMPSSA